MHILTFDIEEWFHIHDTEWVGESSWPALDKRVLKNTGVILDFLETRQLKATFYILGWIAEQYPELVTRIAESGHEIGYHSWRHLRPFRQQKQAFERDLQQGIALLSKLTGQPVTTYRAPDLSMNSESAWMADCLLAHGITSSSSVKEGQKFGRVRVPGRPFMFATGNGRLLEFPVNRLSIPVGRLVFSGSGYFRLWPLMLLKHFYAQREGYTMSYFHPRDFDTGLQKPKELGMVRNWMNTTGNSTTLHKLDNLAGHLPFITVSEAVQQVDQAACQIIRL